MEYLKEFYQRIEDGMKGHNKGVPILNAPRFSKFIRNIQKKRYYLIGGRPKDGKTSLCDSIFLYSLLQAKINKQIDLTVDYFTYELDASTKIAKNVALHLNHTKGLKLSPEDIFSEGDNILDNSIKRLIQIELKNWIDLYSQTITFHPNPERVDSVLEQLQKKGEQLKDKLKNPNFYWLIIVDHISLVDTTGYSNNKKLAIDVLSKGMINIRNKYSASIVIVQQLGADSMSEDRYKRSLKPEEKDLADSKYTVQDANLFLGLYNPHKFQIENMNGYDITRFKDKFRGVMILANRNGTAFEECPFYFEGKTGMFEELPLPNDPKLNDYYKRL